MDWTSSDSNNPTNVRPAPRRKEINSNPASTIDSDGGRVDIVVVDGGVGRMVRTDKLEANCLA